MLLSNQRLNVRQFFAIYFATLVGILLLFLGITGRLHPLFAVIGAILPFVFRIIPWIGRGLQAFSLFRHFRLVLGGQSSSSAGPDQSEIKTRFLHMILIHNTGMMDGKVLEGARRGSQLSNLNLEQLLSLLDECRVDADSLNVLQVYLDREHSDWRDRAGTDGRADHAGSEQMTRDQALKILGLPPGASKDEIIDAHRKMIQKVHPDRGGSTYLAARINEARKRLIGK
jgi:DnaJ domain